MSNKNAHYVCNKCGHYIKLEDKDVLYYYNIDVICECCGKLAANSYMINDKLFKDVLYQIKLHDI